MLRKLSKRAQTTAEYAIVIALVVGAVVAMQTYVKRGLQGRIKSVVDYTGGNTTGSMDGFNWSTPQYEPGETQSDGKTDQSSESSSSIIGGNVTRSDAGNTTVNRTDSTRLDW